MATKLHLRFIAMAICLTLVFIIAFAGGLSVFGNNKIIVHAEGMQTNEYGFADGDGSENDPFIITTPAQLNNMRNYLYKNNPEYIADGYQDYISPLNSEKEDIPEFLPYYFELGADIDLSTALAPGGELYGDGKGWIPIGNAEEVWKSGFYGILDGRKHSVSNLWIDRPETDCTGLFGFVYNTTVKNLNIMLNEKGITGKLNAGAIAGIIDSNFGVNLVKNCSVIGNIKTISPEFNLQGLGGFAGFASLLEIEKSSFEGILNGAGRTGGLTGGADWVSVKNCYVKVVVRTAKHSEAGGIFGYASSFGLSQSLYNHRITNCFVDLICEADTDPFAGDVIHKFDLGFSYYAEREYSVLNGGKYYVDNVAALSEGQQKNKSAYKGFDFDNVWGFDKNGNLVLRTLKEAFDPPAPLNLAWLYITVSCVLFGAAVIITALILYRRKKAVIVKETVIQTETVIKTETVYVEKESKAIGLPDVLSAKEKEIALELLAGTPRAYIAKKHFISDGTVRNHILHIYRKTGCASQIDFILKYRNAKDMPQEP